MSIIVASYGRAATSRPLIDQVTSNFLEFSIDPPGGNRVPQAPDQLQPLRQRLS